ncbi:MAG: hypothetical protein ACTHOM_01480 [Allomuricauda sp.]
MPPIPVLSTFTDFLNQSSPAPLQITFANLSIRNHQNGQFLNHVQRQHGHIMLHKTLHKGVAELTVLDHLVFSFSFKFRMPHVGECQHITMQSLPRPLSHGKLYVDGEQMRLCFTIDAPDPLRCVAVTHVYQGICTLERC